MKIKALFFGNTNVSSQHLLCISSRMQLDKDIRHPLLLEQPSLHAAIISWHTDFELQEIFRKGKRSLTVYNK